MSLPSSARINGNRLWSTIDQSAEIGKGRPGGLARLALTDSDKESANWRLSSDRCPAAAIGRAGDWSQSRGGSDQFDVGIKRKTISDRPRLRRCPTGRF